jgi:hypothetical protein
MIRKTGNQYCVYSDGGKNMGCFGSRGEAERRLAQVEYFKEQDKKGSGKGGKYGGGKKKGGKK